jgi:hypothetical protein
MDTWIFLVGVLIALAVIALLTLYAIRKIEEVPEGGQIKAP